tara:strand:+ start:1697 stop:1891 length:195 start_codon:yes stop_codon:yes gene_type:complete
MRAGDLVRYTPGGKIDDRWVDWYGLVVKEDPIHPAFFSVVRWVKYSETTLSIRKEDLTVINESR